MSSRTISRLLADAAVVVFMAMGGAAYQANGWFGLFLAAALVVIAIEVQSIIGEMVKADDA